MVGIMVHVVTTLISRLTFLILHSRGLLPVKSILLHLCVQKMTTPRREECLSLLGMNGLACAIHLVPWLVGWLVVVLGTPDLKKTHLSRKTWQWLLIRGLASNLTIFTQTQAKVIAEDNEKKEKKKREPRARFAHFYRAIRL